MSKDLRDFLFRGLMFEAEATNFQSAGIQVGADARDAEQKLLTEALAPFSGSPLFHVGSFRSSLPAMR